MKREYQNDYLLIASGDVRKYRGERMECKARQLIQRDSVMATEKSEKKTSWSLGVA